MFAGNGKRVHRVLPFIALIAAAGCVPYEPKSSSAMSYQSISASEGAPIHSLRFPASIKVATCSGPGNCST